MAVVLPRYKAIADVTHLGIVDIKAMSIIIPSVIMFFFLLFVDSFISCSLLLFEANGSTKACIFLFCITILTIIRRYIVTMATVKIITEKSKIRNLNSVDFMTHGLPFCKNSATGTVNVYRWVTIKLIPTALLDVILFKLTFEICSVAFNLSKHIINT
jgi:hypothetical protein